MTTTASGQKGNGREPRRLKTGAAQGLGSFPWSALAQLVLALVDQGLLLDPGHHGAQLGADLLDLVGVVEAAGGLEAGLAGLALADPLRGEVAGLDVLEDALHLGAGLVVDDARARHVLAVLGGVGDRVDCRSAAPWASQAAHLGVVRLRPCSSTGAAANQVPLPFTPGLSGD